MKEAESLTKKSFDALVDRLMGKPPSEFTPEEYCDLVHTRYIEAFRNKHGNASPFWIHWSLELNKSWIQRCADNERDMRFKASLVFWWNCDERLRLRKAKPHHNEKVKRRLNKDAARLRSAASGKVVLRPESQDYQKINKNYTHIHAHHITYFDKIAAEKKDAEEKVMEITPEDVEKRLKRAIEEPPVVLKPV